MEKYRTYRLGEIAECSLGKMLDQKKNKGNPKVYLGNVAVRWGTFNVDDSQTMLFEDDELFRYQAIKGDIVMCEGGEPGRCAMWEEESPICLQKALHRIRVNEEIAYSYYVYYYLTAFIKSGKADPFFTGSTIKHLPRERLISLEITLPCLGEQKRRAAIIRSLDEKIAINNRINHNLKEQAQALYKSWFIDFEPFKGGKFVDSELGMIPKGWRVGRIADIVADTYNGDWGKDGLTGSFTKRVFCIRGADIPSLCVGNSGKMPIRFIQEKHFQSKFLKDGDIVVEISGGSPTQSTGRHCRISDLLVERYNNSLVCTNFCKAVRPKEGYSFFLSLLWEYLYDSGIMYSYENGTTGIKNLDLAGLLAGEAVVIPSIDIVMSFSQMISSMNQKVLFNGYENERLAAQRDAILPKLMSDSYNWTR